MATAPRPGAVRENEQSEEVAAALRQVVTIECGADGRSLSFSMGDVTARDDLACRKATGMNTGELVGATQVGQLEVLALWWLARRHNGEPDLLLEDVLDEFPTQGDFLAAGFKSPEIEDEEAAGGKLPEV